MDERTGLSGVIGARSAAPAGPTPRRRAIPYSRRVVRVEAQQRRQGVLGRRIQDHGVGFGRLHPPDPKWWTKPSRQAELTGLPPNTCRIGGYHHVMSDSRTALEHLLVGRDTLAREVTRLTAALAELDSAIVRISAADSTGAVSRGPRAAKPAGGAARARTGRAKTGRSRTGPVKSIRVHVLEMLAAQDRWFAMSEIIEGIRAQGISAHDDAVRSIAVKLMNSGEVERVGRGRYRLARPHGSPQAGAPEGA